MYSRYVQIFGKCRNHITYLLESLRTQNHISNKESTRLDSTWLKLPYGFIIRTECAQNNQIEAPKLSRLIVYFLTSISPTSAIIHFVLSQLRERKNYHNICIQCINCTKCKHAKSHTNTHLVWKKVS